MNVTVFQSFLPVADQTQHLIPISNEALSFIHLDVVLLDEAIVFQDDSLGILKIILFLKGFYFIPNLKNSASFIHFANHHTDDFQKGVFIGIVTIKRRALLSINQ